jgi:hypothetical protein
MLPSPMVRFIAAHMVKASQQRLDYCRLLTVSAKTTYDAIGEVYCPILKEDVAFNARGFHHLLNDADGTPRTVNERIYKLTLVPLAVPVIRNATSVAEERDVEMRENRKKNAVLKKAKTYSLVAVVGRKNPVAVRVVLLRIGNGKLMFRSIMKN